MFILEPLPSQKFSLNSLGHLFALNPAEELPGDASRRWNGMRMACWGSMSVYFNVPEWLQIAKGKNTLKKIDVIPF